MEYSVGQLAYRWATVMNRRHPELVDEFLGAQSLRRNTIPFPGEASVRSQIKNHRILQTCRGPYEYPGMLITERDWWYVEQTLRNTKSYVASYGPECLAHYQWIAKNVDHDFHRADTRTNYKAIAEAICHRAAWDGSTQRIWFANRSIRMWTESTYYELTPNDAVLDRAYKYFRNKDFMIIRYGIPIKGERPNQFTLNTDPFSTTTDEEANEWLHWRAASMEAVRQREQWAHEDYQDAWDSSREYVDEFGHKRVRMGRGIFGF